MLRIAARPPEVFPRLEYCTLLLLADRFVLGDTFQHVRQSGQARYRIRGPEGPRWLSIPTVRATRGGRIAEVRTAVTAESWQRRHLRTLQFCYGRAPFWEHFVPEIEHVLLADTTSLSDLAVASVRASARWLKSSAVVEVASDLPDSPFTLADIVGEAMPKRLITLSESEEQDREVAESLGVHCETLRFTERPRRQVFEAFVPGLSILDLVLNYGPASRDVLISCIESGSL